MNIRDSLERVIERIQKACQRAGREMEEVRIVAVTKGVDVERIAQARECGLKDFGENYVQEARRKIEALGAEGIQWHMIGHVQANKAKYLPKLFSLVHSVDRMDIVERLERLCARMDVLFELNLSGESTKFGLDEDGLKRILEHVRALRYVRPVGLMTMAPATRDPEETRPIFRRLREIMEAANREFSLDLRELSMGMSQDFEVAIEEGATMVRIGRAIFGERG